MAPPKKAPVETRGTAVVQTSEFDENVKWLETTLKRFTGSFPEIQEAASLMSGDRLKHRAELEILVSQVVRQFTGSALEMAEEMKRKLERFIKRRKEAKRAGLIEADAKPGASAPSSSSTAAAVPSATSALVVAPSTAAVQTEEVIGN